MATCNKCSEDTNKAYEKKDELSEETKFVLVAIFFLVGGFLLAWLVFDDMYMMNSGVSRIIDGIKLNLQLMEIAAQKSPNNRKLVFDVLKRVKEVIEFEVRRIG